MCLAHDLAESIIGDITPSDGISKEEKFAKEKVNRHCINGSKRHDMY